MGLNVLRGIPYKFKGTAMSIMALTTVTTVPVISLASGMLYPAGKVRA